MRFASSLPACLSLLFASTVLAADGYYIKAYTRDLPLTKYHHESGYFLKSTDGHSKTAIEIIDARIGAGWEDAKWVITNELMGQDSKMYNLADYATHKQSVNSNVWRGLSIEYVDDARVGGTLGTYNNGEDWVKVEVLQTKDKTTVFELFADKGMWREYLVFLVFFYLYITMSARLTFAHIASGLLSKYGKKY